jgi:hypothetical protein
MCLVSVIIVNWNGRHFLQECLDSVLTQGFADFEVIVVDNGSSDGSSEFIRNNYHSVKLVCLAENRGFTGGNLAGYDVALGQYIALLNNDTQVDGAWLKSLVGIMQTQPDVGICASRIIIDGTNLIDSAGDMMTTAFSGTKVGHRQPASLYEESRTVHGGCAAAILYRKCMLDQIGFLDDDFFFNHEDTDLNMRAWLAGWKCEYVPEAVVYHKVSGSIGHLSAGTVYYFSRNSLWVLIKNIPLPVMFLCLPQRILYEAASFVYYCLMHGQWRSYVRGKYDAIKGIPKMWRKRKQYSVNRKLKNREILRSLLPITRYIFERINAKEKLSV